MGDVVDGTARAANSKSSSATATPSRNTTFSGHTSLWHTSVLPAGSARRPSQVSPRESNPRRVMQATQEPGDGCQRSVRLAPVRIGRHGDLPVDEHEALPSSSMPTGMGAPSNPASHRPQEGMIDLECGFDGRSTCGPTHDLAHVRDPAFEPLLSHAPRSQSADSSPEERTAREPVSARATVVGPGVDHARALRTADPQRAGHDLQSRQPVAAPKSSEKNRFTACLWIGCSMTCRAASSLSHAVIVYRRSPIPTPIQLRNPGSSRSRRRAGGSALAPRRLRPPIAAIHVSVSRPARADRRSPSRSSARIRTGTDRPTAVGRVPAARAARTWSGGRSSPRRWTRRRPSW